MAKDLSHALSLYKSLAAASKGENVFFSPISIYTAFGMVYTGSENVTKAELSSLFGFADADEEFLKNMKGMHDVIEGIQKQGNVQLTMANKMYSEKTYAIQEAFKQALVSSFNSSMESVDFRGNAEGSRVAINDWVEKKTQAKIQDLLPSGSITADTAMVLANAIYFKGFWQNQFSADETSDMDFHLSKTEKVKVRMMHKEAHFNFKEDGDLKASIVQIPYKGKDMFFTAIVPFEVDGLSAVVEKLTAEKMASLTQGLRGMKLKLFMPKFKITAQAQLKAHMQGLGVNRVFSGEAELGKISAGGPPLYVSEAFHKAFIEVNEEGTEAAAATGMRVMMACMPLPPREVHLDRPFLYIITDSSISYFMGNVVRL